MLYCIRIHKAQLKTLNRIGEIKSDLDDQLKCLSIGLTNVYSLVEELRESLVEPLHIYHMVAKYRNLQDHAPKPHKKRGRKPKYLEKKDG